MCAEWKIIFTPPRPAVERRVTGAEFRALQRQLEVVYSPGAMSSAADRRKRSTETSLLDDVSMKALALESVERVWGLGLSVGALIRRAHSWMQRIFHLKDLCESAAAQAGAAYAEPVGKPVYPDYNAWASQADAQVKKGQIENVLDVFTTSSIVSRSPASTDMNRRAWETAEAGCREFLVVEMLEDSSGDMLFDKVRAEVGKQVLAKIRQEGQQTAQQVNANVGANVGSRDAVLFTIPKQLSTVTLQSFLDGISAGGDSAITFESTKKALSNYEHLLEQLVSFATANKHRVATEGEATLVREWIAAQQSMVDPSSAKEEAEKRAKKFVQNGKMPTARYLKEKRRLCERAKSAGDAAGEVDASFQSEKEWCDLAVAGLLPKLQEEVKRHCLSVIGVGAPPAGGRTVIARPY